MRSLFFSKLFQFSRVIFILSCLFVRIKGHSRNLFRELDQKIDAAEVSLEKAENANLRNTRAMKSGRKLWGFFQEKEELKYAPIAPPKATVKPSPAELELPILSNFSKPIADWIDLDDVKPGHVWIPISIDKFDPYTKDPIIKMCQLNYAHYSNEPWKHPMGNLLNVFSECEDLFSDHVKLLKSSVLETIVAMEESNIIYPTGFIYHETRCGSTLVANMLASITENIVWSESTGPWKVLHTCKECQTAQLAKYLRLIMSLMGRPGPGIHTPTRLFFKLQSSESIDILSEAFPDVPWIFLFREPIEVIMSRMGAQRLGMEGAHDDVALKLEQLAEKREGSKQSHEMKHAKTLAGYCQKAIAASKERPGLGMMIEYTHLPAVIWDNVLPYHFGININAEEKESLLKATSIYSKATESEKTKFSDDKEEKHLAASYAVKVAAERVLSPLYRELQDMQWWLNS